MKRYTVLNVLGDGAFGTVMKCRDKETGEIVAIKKFKEKYKDFDECLQLKEVKSLRKIKHENVERLLSVFRENDTFYMVFELLQGSLLHTMEVRSNRFKESEIRYIMHQLLSGLQYVHKQGFFHRDIKPDNLLWGGKTLKIADFGLAREIRSRPPYTEYISTRWYRAPEIILRHEFYNSPVDIWAAACIMAELYMGRPIFQGTSETDQMYKICSIMGNPTTQNWADSEKLILRLGFRLPQATSVPLQTLMPNASEQAIDLMYQMLSYDPAARPSAGQALQHPYFNNLMEAPDLEEKSKENETAHSKTPMLKISGMKQSLYDADQSPRILKQKDTNSMYENMPPINSGRKTAFLENTPQINSGRKTGLTENAQPPNSGRKTSFLGNLHQQNAGKKNTLLENMYRTPNSGRNTSLLENTRPPHSGRNTSFLENVRPPHSGRNTSFLENARPPHSGRKTSLLENVPPSKAGGKKNYLFDSPYSNTPFAAPPKPSVTPTRFGGILDKAALPHKHFNQNGNILPTGFMAHQLPSSIPTKEMHTEGFRGGKQNFDLDDNIFL